MRSLRQVWVLPGLMLAFGCSGGPKAVPPGPTDNQILIEDAKQESEEAAEAEIAAAQAEEPVVPPAEEEPEESDDSLVFVDIPEEEPPEQPTLFEAAQKERARREQEAWRSGIVITDENLKEHAEGGRLTVAQGPDPAAAPSEASEQASELAQMETYWRKQARDARLRWRDAYESVIELEERTAELRRDFYSTDDGFYRDSQIKPAWDEALDDLEHARTEVEIAQEALERLLEEGREAGAQAGWLREGLEFEPEIPEEPDGPAEHDSIEPPIYREDDGDGGAVL